jgi:hypothetical protein
MTTYSTARSQEKGGMEQYYYTGLGAASIVPKLYYQSSNKWRSEVRYNYEEVQTLSFNTGKVITADKRLGLTVTPMAGIVVGGLNGGNIGCNVNLDYKKLFVSSESQFTLSIEQKTQRFFFNWSEAGYQIFDFMFAGIALQVTRPYEIKNKWQPGVMAGFSYKSWSFPLYAFNPASDKRNYVIGVDWEWQGKKL